MVALSYNGISLAPMAGYSDMPFRSICRRSGSALAYTEFVSTESVVRGNLRTLQMLRFKEEERPVLFQIFGHDRDTILEAALILEELRPDGIDVNLGCSVPKISQKGCGAALLQEPAKIGRIIEALATNLRIPVSAKMRLGWTTSSSAAEIARRIEDSGASMIAVHGRTAGQRYTGEADWPTILEIREAVSIPLLGNGDIRSHAQARSMIQKYGLEGVLIGRAAHGNPWIFRSDAPVPANEVQHVVGEHLNEMIEFHGPDQGILRFRKHAIQYARHLVLTPEGRAEILSALSVDELIDAFSRLSVRDETGIASPYSSRFPDLQEPGVLSDFLRLDSIPALSDSVRT